VCQRQSAYGAIREELEARGISLSAIERPLVSLVEMFRNAHQPITKHLFSDAGIWLQNLDSDIMHGEVAPFKHWPEKIALPGLQE
jgi:hypothetical protein